LREKLLLSIAALIAFGGCLFAPFQFDDAALFADPAITSPSGWWQCWRITQTRPLTWFTFWANYQLGGRSPWGYHAVNLALHLAAVALVWDVLRRLIPARAAFLAAAIFAVHPIMTEPVAYVFARGTLIAAVFGLLAIRSWLDGRPWLAVAWFAVAMTGKEECAAVPIVLLLLLSKHRAQRSGPRSSSLTSERVPRCALLSKHRAQRSGPRLFSLTSERVPRCALPVKPKHARALSAMFGVALAFGVRAIWAASVTAGSGAGTQSGISPLAYVATQGIVILRYLRLFVVPWGFTVDAEIARPPVWIAILAWVAVGTIAAVLLSKHRAQRSGPRLFSLTSERVPRCALLKTRIGTKTRAGVWFVAGLVLLLPSSSIFPAADLAADRRMYLPMAAFCACAAVLAESIGSSINRRVMIAARAAVMIVLCGISIHYTGLWRSPEALWTEAVLRAPGKTRPRLQLARALPPDRALETLAEAARRAPDDPEVASEQGRNLLTLGRAAEALAAYGRALALDPENPSGLNNRGAALLALGQVEAARTDFERAIARDQCLFDARLNLLRMGVSIRGPEGCRYTPEQQALLSGNGLQ